MAIGPNQSLLASILQIGVLFIGGPNEVESLVYSARMVQHEVVQVTVIQIKDPSELYQKTKREELDVAIFNLREIHNYDEHERSMLISQLSFEKTFGLSTAFIESTLMENGGVPDSVNLAKLIQEAIHVISCNYEEKTAWGKEIGWIYGSITDREDLSSLIKVILDSPSQFIDD